MILALDIATTTGVAVGEPRGLPVASSFTLKGDHGDRFAELARRVNAMLKEHRPALVAFEAPFVGPNTSAARFLFGARGVVMGITGLWGIPMTEITVASARRHFIGSAGWRGKEGKQRVSERCTSLGWDHANLDESDALCVWSFAAASVSPEHSRETLRVFNAERQAVPAKV